MDPKLKLTTLPPEIRQQIFKEYFKDNEGYVYDAVLDKLTIADEVHTPIDLSLRFTCRSIAEDTKNIPLAVNPIQFSAAFREDWRSLAGCFNVAATVYHLLEQDFVLHLAECITPDMYSELCSQFPTFGAKLASQAASHRTYVEGAMDEERLWLQRRQQRQLVEDLDGDDELGPEPSDHTHCISVRRFLRENIHRPFRQSPCLYTDFGAIHETPTGLFSDLTYHPDGNPRQDKSKDDRAAVSYCLRLIAEHSPKDFAKYLFSVFPHWAGKYNTQDFLHLRPNPWDIPVRDHVHRMLQMLNIGDYLWQFPDMWSYSASFYDLDDNGFSPHYLFPDAYLDPLRFGKRFDVRFRDKVGFSATAAAIRFVGRLPREQRTKIRRLVLRENMDSVNVPSLHAQGLIPFFKENSTLQVERRISVFGCILSNRDAVDDALWKWREGNYGHLAIWAPDFTNAVSCWLLDALAVLDSGIPAKSFNLVLEAGLHGNLGREIFQGSIHREIAKSKAYFTCLEKGMFQGFASDVFQNRAYQFAIHGRFEEAV